MKVNESAYCYRAMQFVPTWDGTMFEALMVSLLVPEAESAPGSWGANHPRYVRAQIEYGLHDAQLGYWGLSAASAPDGGYGDLRRRRARCSDSQRADQRQSHANRGRRPLRLVPGAALRPEEAMANLRALADHFPVYGSYGFHDSVDVLNGKVSDRMLVLDQGMILAVLARMIGGDSLRRGFSDGAFETAIRPLISQEQFAIRTDTNAAASSMPEYSQEALDSLEGVSSATLSDDPTRGRTRLLGHTFMGSFVAALGFYIVLAGGLRIARGYRPSYLANLP